MAYAILVAKAPRPDLYYCSCEIKLLDNPHSEIKTPYDTLSGLVIIHSESPNCFLRTVRVQLVGHAITRFQSKIEHKLTKVYLDENFIPEEVAGSESLSVYVVGSKKMTGNNYEEATRFSPGAHIFPFKIHLRGQQFPATFQSTFGQILYKLVVYAEQGSNKEVVAANKKILYPTGHYSLSQDPNLSEPLVVTKTKDRSSFFSKRPLLKLSLFLERRGYVPEENLNLPLILENPTCETIVKIYLALVQRITYFGSEFHLQKKMSKTTRTVVVEKVNFCNTNDGEIGWNVSLFLPAQLIPTFMPSSKCIEITYSIEFLVSMTGTAQLKGETEIVIGTKTQDNIMSCSNSGNSLSDVNWDTVSIQTCSTLPPGYSTLSSRRPSLETLPPSYAEVIRNQSERLEEFCQDFRARCSSNVF